MCYTSRVFGAEEAKSVGFIGGGASDSNGVFRDKKEAMAAAVKIGSAIAANSPVAVQGTKRLIDWSRDHSIDDGTSAHVLFVRTLFRPLEDLTRQLQAWR